MRTFLTVCVLAVFLGQSSLVLAQNGPPAGNAQAKDDPLLKLVDEAISVTKQRHLDFQVHTPWQIMHGLLAGRAEYLLKNGSETVNGLEFITREARFKGDRWFEATQYGGRAHPYNGTPYDFEGHVNQTLAVISMCDVPLTYEFHLDGGKTVTMADMLRHAQMTVNTREETTWTLWLLTHYLDQETTWTNAWGQQWSIETLVRIQTASNVQKGPCGGCHGLFALAYARNAYLRKHGQLRGSWLEADQKLQQYIAASQAMQNRDGSFSSEFYKSRGYSTDFNKRINATGHILEWLMMALPRKRLDEYWVRLAVQSLANDLIRNSAQPADCGPLYHSMHALVLYKQRIAPEETPSAPAELASRPDQLRSTGPVTLEAPNDESMPRAELERREQIGPAATEPDAVTIADAPLPSSQSGIATEQNTTTDSAPATGMTGEAEDRKAFQKPLIVPNEPSTAPPLTATPTPATNASEKPLVIPSNPPALLSPPKEETPMTAETELPVQTQQGPTKAAAKREVKELSGENQPGQDFATPLADSLSPVAGGMPIFKRPESPSAEQAVAAGETSQGEEKKADASPPKADNDAAAQTAAGDQKAIN